MAAGYLDSLEGRPRPQSMTVRRVFYSKPGLTAMRRTVASGSAATRWVLATEYLLEAMGIVGYRPCAVHDRPVSRAAVRPRQHAWRQGFT